MGEEVAYGVTATLYHYASNFFSQYYASNAYHKDKFNSQQASILFLYYVGTVPKQSMMIDEWMLNKYCDGLNNDKLGAMKYANGNSGFAVDSSDMGSDGGPCGQKVEALQRVA